MVTEFEKHPIPLKARQRRAFLSRYAEILATHPYAMRLLVRDLSSITQLSVPPSGPAITSRLMALLEGPDPDTEQQLANLCRARRDPASDGGAGGRDGRGARTTLVQCALAAYSSKG